MKDERNIMRWIEGLRDWLGSHKREEEGKEGKKTKESPYMVRFAQFNRKGIGIIVFQFRGRGKEPFLPMEKATGEKILLDIRYRFVRESQ